MRVLVALVDGLHSVLTFHRHSAQLADWKDGSKSASLPEEKKERSGSALSGDFRFPTCCVFSLGIQ